MIRSLFLALSSIVLLVLLGFQSSPLAAHPAAVATLPPVQNPDGRAGACYSFYPDPPDGPNRPFISMAYDAGSRWDRFDFSWPAIERTDDQCNFEAHDSVVNDLRSAGIKNIVGILQMTPKWAATQSVASQGIGPLDRPPARYVPGPTPPEAHHAPSAMSPLALEPCDDWGDRWVKTPPKGLDEEWYDWTAADGDPINYWGRFVHNTVSQYKGKVQYWEMWNEPEWNYFWTGTSTQYARLLKVGYQATKEACPDCKVLFGGLHYWANRDYYKWVLNTLSEDPKAPQNNYFFDVMSVHLYSRSANTYDVVNDIRTGMTARVSDHPIWLTETGVPVWGDDQVSPKEEYDYAATQDEAAAYTIQSYANAWASSVERYFFFRTHDADMDEYFGLIRNDRSLRPAYVAYQVATTYLISPTMATSQDYGSGIRRVTLWGTPHGKVSVLWNTTPDEVKFGYPAALPSATRFDRSGVTKTITPTDDVYALTLPGATAFVTDEDTDERDYFIGGDPYLVIEHDTTAPTAAAMEDLPATTYSYTVAIPCTATDEGAGIWGFEIQVQEKGSPAWTDWPGIHPSPVPFTGGEHGNTYCFRARAWDKAGNHGEWFQASDQPCTTLDLGRRIHLEVGSVFGDENSSGGQDEGEAALTDIRFRFIDGTGADVVTPTVGSSWEFTQKLTAGDYTLIATPQSWWSPPPGWLPRLMPVAVQPGVGVQQQATDHLGLLPHRSSSILPIIFRSQ